MNIEFKLEAFEGPLDLLLLLIEKNKVDIYDIPIAEITDQYVAYVANMEKSNLDLLSDFLVVATTLLDIKAKMLLPKEENEFGEEIDPRAELVERLVEYQEFKLMAEKLKEQYASGQDNWYRDMDLPQDLKKYRPKPDAELVLQDVTLERLKEIFVSVIERKEQSLDPIRSDFHAIEREPIRISDKFRQIHRFSKNKKQFSFRELLEEGKSKQEIVVTFLACLELIKIGQILVKQEELLGEIDFTWNDECTVKIADEDWDQYD